MDKLTLSLVKRLGEKKLSLALAESVTCGLAAHKLGTVIGASEVFKGSVVCYGEEVKIKLFGISKKLIKKHSAESMRVTRALSEKLPALIKADICAALTGLAAAGGSETKSKPVGTVFFCVKYKGKLSGRRKVFKGSPLEIREKACKELFRFLLSKI